MSTQFNDQELDQIEAFLSKERLRKLANITGNREIAVDVHQRTIGLNSQLMKIVATIEIALRNTIYENISSYYSVSNWLQQPPVKIQLKSGDISKIISAIDSAKRSEYAKKSQAEKNALKMQAFPSGKPVGIGQLKFIKKKRENIIVSDGKIIAELTFAFWKRLYSPEYEYHLWNTTLKRTFPNKKLKRSQVSSQLEIIYQMRNRIAHQEIVFGDRFRKLIEAVIFVISELDYRGKAEQSPLHKLLESDIIIALKRHDEIEEILEKYRKTSK